MVDSRNLKGCCTLHEILLASFIICLTLREEVGVRLAGRLRGRQPLQRRGVVRGRVGYGDLHAGTGFEKLL